MAKHSDIFRRGLFGLVALSMLTIGLTPVSYAQQPNSPQQLRSNRVSWLNGDYFLSGINYPFYRYYGGDIATLTSRDDSGNVVTESAFDAVAIERDFAKMEAGGVHVLRWFLFGDGRGAPEFNDSGIVTGLDATFFDHMDQVLEIAQRHNIYIIWSLLDFLAFKHGNWLCGGTGSYESLMGKAALGLPDGPRQQYEQHLREAAHKEAVGTNGKLKDLVSTDKADSGQYCFVYAGGHRNLVNDAGSGGAQDSFFNNALIPLLQHYASNENIIGWEIMNEPEWIVDDVARMGQAATVEEPVALAPLRAFFQRFTAAVHQYAPEQLATVGSASLRWMGADSDPVRSENVWQGLGFDYYGAHYYGWMENGIDTASPLALNYNSMTNLDAPVVIGEFPANGGTPPVYVPNLRRLGSEDSALTVRSICSDYWKANDTPCTRPSTVQIEYYNPNGTVAVSQTLTLPPGGSTTLAVPGQLNDWTGSARIIANGPVAAQVSQYHIANAAESVTYLGQDRGANKLYLPLMLNLTGHHRTRLALQNTTVATATLTIRYYQRDGRTAGPTGSITLTPRGMALIDPEFVTDANSGEYGDSTPLGFQGAASVESDQPLVGVAYELDPVNGSDAYNAVPEAYGHTLNLPSVRNAGSDGTPSIYLQNAWNDSKSVKLTYYAADGTPLPSVVSDTITLAGYSSVEIKPASRLPAQFDGSVVVDSTPFIAAVVRSATTATGGKSVSLYSGNQDSSDRFHFPNVTTAGGMTTKLTVQNTDLTHSIDVIALFSTPAGATTTYTTTIAPHAMATINAAAVVGNNFTGSAELVWEWVNGWNAGFPMIAAGRTYATPRSSGEGFMGMISHTQSWSVTPYTPRQILDGLLGNNWAGAMSWSFYDSGTGQWDDYVEASKGFNDAHPELVNIAGGSPPAPTRTPTVTRTATATGTATPTGSVTPTRTPSPNCAFNFSDVHSDQYFYEPVRALFCAGVISGYSDGTFKPFANATRGQLAKIITLSHGWAIDTTGGPHFTDVSETNPFYGFIETAYNKHVISGYADGSFKWGNNITRGQLSKIIVLASGWNTNTQGAPHFSDVSVNNAFYGFIETAYNKGIIAGYTLSGGDLEFRWGANATRGQIGKIVYLALNPASN